MPERKITTDHDTIRRWVEERQGRPTTVRGTGGEAKAGVLRIDFPGHKGARLEGISWEDFFAKFDEKGLAFLYQEMTSQGQPSRFCRFVRRGSVGIENQRPKGMGTVAHPGPLGQAAGQERGHGESRSL